MKSFKLTLILGFLAWLIPFIVSFLIFPLRSSDRTLFESIMPVVVTIITLLLSIYYFRRIESEFLKEGVLLGLIWFIICIAIDLLMFMHGPMKMTFIEYMKDIGLTYLIIPSITIGFGYLIKKEK